MRDFTDSQPGIIDDERMGRGVLRKTGIILRHGRKADSCPACVLQQLLVRLKSCSRKQAGFYGYIPSARRGYGGNGCAYD